MGKPITYAANDAAMLFATRLMNKNERPFVPASCYFESYAGKTGTGMNTSVAGGTGATATVLFGANAPSDAFGVLNMSIAAGSTANYGYWTNNDNNLFKPGSGSNGYYYARFKLSQLSDATENFIFYQGVSNFQASSTDPTYGYFLKYNHGINSGKFQLITVNGGAATATDTGVTVAADTWYELWMIRLGATSVKCTIKVGGTPTSVSSSTAVPSGGAGNTSVSSMGKIARQTVNGSTAIVAQVDTCFWQVEYN